MKAAPTLNDADGFRRLFESSPDVLLVLAPDSPRFTMVAATEARLNVTHTTRDQIIGKGLFELFPDNPDDPEATGTANLRASLERVLALRAPDTMAVQKYDIRGPDGTFEAKYWSPKNLPVLSDVGEVLFILHRVEDVTELVRASESTEELRGRTAEMEREVIRRSQELAATNAQLRAANAKLGELDAAKTTFFSNISHEFRTPLTLMLAPAEDALLLPERSLQGDALEMVHRNMLRLMKLVNALLDFSRIEAGRMQASFMATDLSALTRDLVSSFSVAVERGGLSLVVDCPALDEAVFVDRGMWEKIVLNLVSNALKFTFTGTISVSLLAKGADVELSVRDTGVGIPEHELPRIFERFHRVTGAASRTHEGSGIGLALVSELVRLHQGRIEVSSTPGKGTCFMVRIPRGQEHLPREHVYITSPGMDGDISGRSGPMFVAEASRWTDRSLVEQAANTESSAAYQDGERPRVLVVDDNADLRDYISEILAGSFQVETARDGLEGLEAVRKTKPDLVLSDVMMPRLDGIGFLRALREEDATRDLPVILLSARAGEEAAIGGYESGADDYLIKPFSSRELLARVRTYVDLTRKRHQWARELDQKARELAAANKDLESFSFSVSHDLRAPVRRILSVIELLEMRGQDLGSDEDATLKGIKTAAQRMWELIEDLLSFARTSRQNLSRNRVAMNSLVSDTVGELATDSAGRNVIWNVGNLPDVTGDRSLLKQVWLNLISNALKYSRPRNPARIEIGGTVDADQCIYFVKDNGVGFDVKEAKDLFGVFRRFHSQQDFEGHGIGLANVQRIVKRHGGNVWAESGEGMGAAFFFSLPHS